MHAFVTGGTGLLGGTLVRLLAAQGHEVRLLARSRRKAETLFAGMNVAVVEGDMADLAGFAAGLDGCDVLFHTAAYFREYFGAGDHWAKLRAINVDATVALLEAAEQRGVAKAIYTSSSGVIGRAAAGVPADEATAPDALVQENLYFRSKLLAEEAVQGFLKRSTLPVVLILPGWMWGPGDAAPTASGQLVLDFMNRKLPALPPGGGTPVDVRDVAAAMIAAVERGRSGERYLVGGDRAYSFVELAALLQQASGVAAPCLQLPYGLAMAFAWGAERWSQLTGTPTLITRSGIRTLREPHLTNSAKAVRELGATFRPFAETVRDTVEWYRAHQPERLMGTALPQPSAGA